MVFQKAAPSARPLPLKQRTSSQDTRRDYSSSTWSSLLVLLKVREYFVTVDNFSIWRRHLAWAHENGKELRGYMTQRYSSNMVFMSLLLSTQLGVLFNSAPVTTNVRHALSEGNHFDLSFYAGFMIIVSSLLTILSLIAVFTAWSMVNAVDENNAHCIFRSSIGQYAAELPGRLIVCSIYSFLLSFILFFFLLLPVGFWAFSLLLITTLGFLHIVSVFSAFGRVIMHSGAMGKARIFTPEYEELLLPHTLHSNLLAKAQANLANNASIIRQYRRKQKPIDRHLSEYEMYDHLSGFFDRVDEEDIPYRPRADSTVRFADQERMDPSPSKSSLTPISDTSSKQQFSSESSFPEQQAKPRAPTPPPPLPPGNQKRKSPPPPLRPTHLPAPSSLSIPTPAMTPFASTSASASDSLRNVSTSSLEQWLQASPTAAPGGEQGEAARATIEGSMRPSTYASRLKQPSPPPKRGGGSSLSSNQQPLSRPGVVEITIDSAMSEEERFNMDYGDDIDDDPSPRARGVSDEEYDVVEYLDDQDEERTSLLQPGGRRGNNNTTYSSVSSNNDDRPPLIGRASPRFNPK